MMTGENLGPFPPNRTQNSLGNSMPVNTSFLPLTQRIYQRDNQEWLNEINGNWPQRVLELRVCGGFPGEGNIGEWGK